MKSNLPFKRIVAYIIDFLVITVISSALTYLTFINPKYEKYKEASGEYNKIVEKYYEGVSNGSQELKDKTKTIENAVKEYKDASSVEEVSKQSEEFSNYLSDYDFGKLDLEELKSKVEEYKGHIQTEDDSQNELEKKLEEYIVYINTYSDENPSVTDLQAKMQTLSYDLLKNGYVYIIGDIVIALLYFGVFNYVTKGQTLGKRLMRIRIVSKDNGDVKIHQYVIRAVILNGIILNVVSLIAVCFNRATFTRLYKYGSNLDNILILINFLMIMFMKNGRGLHDILAGTKVVDLKEVANKEEKNEEVEEAIVKEVKPKTTKKTTTTKKKTTTKKENKKDEK